MNYKAIGFDYGGVIGGVGTTGKFFAREVSELLGISEARYKDVYFSLNYLVNTGEVADWREFWSLVLEKLGKSEKLEALVRLSDEKSKLLEVIDVRIVDLIDTLKQNGYKTGLLSNTTKEGDRKMRAAGLDTYFDVFHISAETRLMKPNPKAFEHFIRALGVKSAELIFIDDSEKSLSTAEECGFTPVQFESYKQVKAELQKLGVNLS